MEEDLIRWDMRNMRITTTGIVIPVHWDETGTPLALAIFTDEEQEYLIDDANEIGRMLHTLIRQRIRVTGVLDDSLENRQRITVKTFERIEGREDEMLWLPSGSVEALRSDPAQESTPGGFDGDSESASGRTLVPRI